MKNIAKLSVESTLDEAFTKNVGTGADGSATEIRYDKNKKKILIAEEFSKFNGIPVQSVVMLNDDGTHDEIFKVRKVEGGLANFACLFNGGNTVASDALAKYDGATRRDFLVLGRDGKTLQRFNVSDIFQGKLYEVIEVHTSTSSGRLLLLGDSNRSDDNMARNTTMMGVDYE